jgi:hypothetical protein
MPATDPADRRRLFAREVAAHRSRDDGATFVAHDAEDGPTPHLTYGDRIVSMDLSRGALPQRAARDALDELLSEFPVFKLKQPETRRAREGEVYVSALADAKHAADFLEACFRDVYGLGPDYEVTVEADDGEEEEDGSA